MGVISKKPWHVMFLSQEPSSVDLDRLEKTVQALGREFQDGAIIGSEEELSKTNAWYASTEGQVTVKDICIELWTRMSALAAHAMPAHDARHAMYKVPASALCHMDAESVTGFDRLGVLGALMHDYGRWAEERLCGAPGPSVFHARLSFLLCKEVLEEFDMPEYARQQLLLAPLNHSSGAVAADPMIQKLTVSGDRDQLYGPELVLRLAHHSVDDSWNQSSFYGERPGTAILSRLKHFHDNRLPGPLFSRQGHVLKLQEQMRKFILLAESFESSKLRWVGQSGSKFTPALTDEEHQAEWQAVQIEGDATHHSNTVEEAMANLLSAKNIAPGLTHRSVALDKVSSVSPENKRYLIRALDWVRYTQNENDRQEKQELLKIREKYSDDALVTCLTGYLLETGY